MTDLITALKENSNDRVLAYCNECGGEFLDTAKHKVMSANHAASIIKDHAKAHREKTDHNNAQVDIGQPTPSEPVDVTINVNNE